nr:hypothetical protein CFP56_11073 [Quercus suber]
MYRCRATPRYLSSTWPVPRSLEATIQASQSFPANHSAPYDLATMSDVSNPLQHQTAIPESMHEITEPYAPPADRACSHANLDILRLRKRKVKKLPDLDERTIRLRDSDVVRRVAIVGKETGTGFHAPAPDPGSSMHFSLHTRGPSDLVVIATAWQLPVANLGTLFSTPRRRPLLYGMKRRQEQLPPSPPSCSHLPSWLLLGHLGRSVPQVEISADLEQNCPCPEGDVIFKKALPMEQHNGRTFLTCLETTATSRICISKIRTSRVTDRVQAAFPCVPEVSRPILFRSGRQIQDAEPCLFDFVHAPIHASVPARHTVSFELHLVRHGVRTLSVDPRHPAKRPD